MEENGTWREVYSDGDRSLSGLGRGVHCWNGNVNPIEEGFCGQIFCMDRKKWERDLVGRVHCDPLAGACGKNLAVWGPKNRYGLVSGVYRDTLKGELMFLDSIEKWHIPVTIMCFLSWVGACVWVLTR